MRKILERLGFIKPKISLSGIGPELYDYLKRIEPLVYVVRKKNG